MLDLVKVIDSVSSLNTIFVSFCASSTRNDMASVCSSHVNNNDAFVTRTIEKADARRRSFSYIMRDTIRETQAFVFFSFILIYDLICSSVFRAYLLLILFSVDMMWMLMHTRIVREYVTE